MYCLQLSAKVCTPLLCRKPSAADVNCSCVSNPVLEYGFWVSKKVSTNMCPNSCSEIASRFGSGSPPSGRGHVKLSDAREVTFLNQRSLRPAGEIPRYPPGQRGENLPHFLLHAHRSWRQTTQWVSFQNLPKPAVLQTNMEWTSPWHAVMGKYSTMRRVTVTTPSRVFSCNSRSWSVLFLLYHSNVSDYDFYLLSSDVILSFFYPFICAFNAMKQEFNEMRFYCKMSKQLCPRHKIPFCR